MFYEKLMEKTAKTRLIKTVEGLVASGQKEKALELLRKAEASEGVGSYGAREIRGITDEILGRGEHGVVGHAFFGGDVVPAKRIYKSSRGGHYPLEVMRAIELFEREGANSSKIQNLIKSDPDLSRLVQAPRFLASGSTQEGLVGESLKTIKRELEELSAIPRKHMTRAQKSRKRSLHTKINNHRLITDPKFIGSGQALPMSRINFDVKGSLSDAEIKAQQLRAAKAKQILTDRYDIHLSDLNPGRTRNENMAYAHSGKPFLVDFGIVKNRDFVPNYHGMSSGSRGSKDILAEAGNMAVEELVPPPMISPTAISPIAAPRGGEKMTTGKLRASILGRGKRGVAGAALMATGMGLLHVGAKKERAIRAESERLREEMRKREYASPEYKSLERLRRLGTRRLPVEFRHGGDGDEYISELTPAEETKRETLLDRLAKNNRSYEDRIATNEKRRGGRMGALVPSAMFLGGAGLLASSLFKKKG